MPWARQSKKPLSQQLNGFSWSFAEAGITYQSETLVNAGFHNPISEIYRHSYRKNLSLAHFTQPSPRPSDARKATQILPQNFPALHPVLGLFSRFVLTLACLCRNSRNIRNIEHLCGLQLFRPCSGSRNSRNKIAQQIGNSKPSHPFGACFE